MRPPATPQRSSRAARRSDGHLSMNLFHLLSMLVSATMVLVLWGQLPDTALLWWLCARNGVSLLRMAYANVCLYQPTQFRPAACVALTLLDVGIWLTLAWWIPGTDASALILKVSCLAALGSSMAMCVRQRRRRRRMLASLAP